MAATALTSFLPEGTELQNVTPATLQQCSDKIDQHVHQARQELFQLLQAHLQASGSSSSIELDEALDALCSATHFTPGSPEASLVELAQQYREAAAKIKGSEMKLGGLRLASELESMLANFHTRLAAGQLQEAAYCVLGLTKSLQAADEDADVAAALSPALRQDCAACSSQLLQALDQRVDASMKLDADRKHLAVTSSRGSEGGLLEAWTALQLLGELSPRFKSLAESILRELAAPLLTSSSCRVDIAPGPPAMLHWDMQPHVPHVSGSPGIDIETALRKVFVFLAEHVLGKEEELTHEFGDHLWPRLVDSYHQLRVQPLLADPQCSGDIADHVSEAAAQLEELASCLGFVTEEGALAAVVGNCMRAMQHRRQEGLLAEARAVLASSTWEGRVVGAPLHPDADLLQRCGRGELQAWERDDPACGWDTSAGVMPTGSCQVSEAALQLQQLLERAVSQASASTGSVPAAQAMVAAAENIARLARTLPTTGARGRQVASVPQVALLLHNDLQHLATVLLLCTVRQAPALRAALGDCTPAGLVEAAVALRRSAAEVLAEQVSAHQRNMNELLAPLEGFKPAASAQAGLARRKAITQVQHAISRLGRTLVEVLPPSAMMDVAGQVLGNLANRICKDIISKRSIAADESGELATLLRPLAEESVRQLLGGSKQKEVVPGRYGLSSEQVEAMIVGRCQPLQKLQHLVVVLDEKMARITEMWEEGQLEAAGFTRQDTLRLVEALFEDTQFRQECLGRILHARR